jgi:hypothetical protein
MMVAVPIEVWPALLLCTGKIPFVLGDLTLRPRIVMPFLNSALQIQEY